MENHHQTTNDLNHHEARISLGSSPNCPLKHATVALKIDLMENIVDERIDQENTQVP